MSLTHFDPLASIRVFEDAFGEGRDEAEGDAEEKPDADGDDADQDRHARPHEYLRGDVAAEIVGAEPVRERRRRELMRDVDRRGRIGRPDERDRRGDQESRDQRGAEPEARAAAQAKP